MVVVLAEHFRVPPSAIANLSLFIVDELKLLVDCNIVIEIGMVGSNYAVVGIPLLLKYLIHCLIPSF